MQCIHVDQMQIEKVEIKQSPVHSGDEKIIYGMTMEEQGNATCQLTQNNLTSCERTMDIPFMTCSHL